MTGVNPWAMTIGDVRAVLAKIDAKHDACPFMVETDDGFSDAVTGFVDRGEDADGRRSFALVARESIPVGASVD